MAWARELLAAVAHLSPVGSERFAFTDEEMAGSLAFYPAVGLALGVVTAIVSALALRWAGQPSGGVAAVLLLEGWARGRHRRNIAALPALLLPHRWSGRIITGLGVGVASLAFLLKLDCAVHMPPPTLWAACLLAPLLSRWAMVVQTHGGRREYAHGRAVQLVGRAGFREFGAASVCTFVVVLSTAQAIGLLLLLTVALTTLALRVIVAWRIGGFTGRLLGATTELIETVVFAVLAGLVVLGAA